MLPSLAKLPTILPLCENVTRVLNPSAELSPLSRQNGVTLAHLNLEGSSDEETDEEEEPNSISSSPRSRSFPDLESLCSKDDETPRKSHLERLFADSQPSVRDLDPGSSFDNGEVTGMEYLWAGKMIQLSPLSFPNFF